jgi:hypothetical protein
MYRDAIRNTWTVEEVDFSHRHQRPAQRKLRRPSGT